MRKSVLAISISVAIAVAGCDELQGLQSQPLTVQATLNGESPESLANTVKVLEKRLRESQRLIVSSLVTEFDGRIATFTFTNGSPRRGTIEYMLRTVGILRMVVAETGVIGFTEKDLVDASSSYSDGQHSVTIRLTEKSKIRLEKITSNAIGKTATLYWDNVPFLGAVIREPFGDLTFSVSSQDEAINMSRVLRSGPLTTSKITFNISENI
jgi:hypothetical protein